MSANRLHRRDFLKRCLVPLAASGLVTGCASLRPAAESPPVQPRATQIQLAWLASSRVAAQHHIVCLLEIRAGDPKFMEALDEGLNTLKNGSRPVVLFDARSVPWLRVHPRRGNRTLLHDAEISAEARVALAERLGVSPASAPRNYFEYVQYLADAGAIVVVNRDAMQQFGLKDEEIHPIAAVFPRSSGDPLR